MYGCVDPVTGNHISGPVYFTRNYVRIEHPTRGDIPFQLYDYQEEMMNMFAENNKSIVMSARQTGKCIRDNTSLTQVVPLEKSLINTIRKYVLWFLDKKLYDELYGKKDETKKS